MDSSVPTSPIAVVGTITILTAYVIAAVGAFAGIVGNARRDARLVRASVYGLHTFGGLVLLASGLLVYAFVTHDYTIKYVALTSDTSMTTAYKITAFWGALDGSLLFWVMVLAAFSSVAIAANLRRHKDMIGFAVGTILVVQLFFLTLLVFDKNPFDTYVTDPPKDGEGLNPLLQNYWMVIHPPALYVGFVAATIPFAFAIAALASGRLDDMWLSSVRVWALICFFFLSFGLILGGRWAYEELGWGGYWAWDPVENAGFLPWFTMTAFLHTAVVQEQRGLFKSWNLILVILTFFFTIFGTFMTRSGVVQSVHAFGEDNALALQFIVFMVAFLVVSIGLVLHRMPRLRQEGGFESFVSREFAFLLNNWVLLAMAFFVLFVTMMPTITEAMWGERITIGPGFFNRWMTPLGLVLLFLAGAAPLLAWRRTTRERLYAQFLWPGATAVGTVVLLAALVPATRALTPIFDDALRLPVPLLNFGLCAFVFGSIVQEFVRGTQARKKQTGSDGMTSLIGLVLLKRRRYGGYVVHLSIAVMFIGFAGKAWETMTDRTIERPTAVISESLRGAIASAEAVVTPEGGAAADPARVTELATQLQSFEPTRPLGQALAASDTAGVQRELAGLRARAEAIEKGTVPLAEIPREHVFKVRGYTFVYRRLGQVADDNKVATTAYVQLYDRDGSPLELLQPARWNFRKGTEPTTEVDIHEKLAEDVYIILTGYDVSTGLANFRIYINPLINWVWIGFVLLAFGTCICLIPQRVVEAVSRRPTSVAGKAADVGAVLLLVGGLLAATATVAHAQGPGGGGPRPAEHEEELTRSRGHSDDSGWAHRFRPDTPLAESLMKELVCLCGGCKRENLFECKCGYAAQERKKVLALLAGHDLTTEAGRVAARRAVVGAFIREYGGEHVLVTPRSRATWLLPYLAVAGGLVLIFFIGRGLVRRGAAATTPAAVPGSGGERPADADARAAREVYDEKLDDELRDTD
ncbi:MAG: cytochrome c biogenesis protein CcsA [Kofleriaceae bacterium]|nr:cytochrome c biogenesis protein CcsA [Kofleriaceae bacterium]